MIFCQLQSCGREPPWNTHEREYQQSNGFEVGQKGLLTQQPRCIVHNQRTAVGSCREAGPAQQNAPSPRSHLVQS